MVERHVSLIIIPAASSATISKRKVEGYRADDLDRHVAKQRGVPFPLRCSSSSSLFQQSVSRQGSRRGYIAGSIDDDFDNYHAADTRSPCEGRIDWIHSSYGSTLHHAAGPHDLGRRLCLRLRGRVFGLVGLWRFRMFAGVRGLSYPAYHTDLASDGARANRSIPVGIDTHHWRVSC